MVAVVVMVVCVWHVFFLFVCGQQLDVFSPSPAGSTGLCCSRSTVHSHLVAALDFLQLVIARVTQELISTIVSGSFYYPVTYRLWPRHISPAQPLIGARPLGVPRRPVLVPTRPTSHVIPVLSRGIAKTWSQLNTFLLLPIVPAIHPLAILEDPRRSVSLQIPIVWAKPHNFRVTSECDSEISCD